MLRFFVTLSCFFMYLPSLHAQTNVCVEHQCITVIDAGSTGSRAHTYSYDLDETSTPINIQEVWNKKIKPGIASIEPEPNTMTKYLTTLLADAPQPQTPVYFYATAGMRLTPSSRQKKYYQAIQQWFSQQSQWQLMEAKTITGNDEALYDWLSVNYNLGTLKSAQEPAIGVMDVGGASVQIVFPIQNYEKINPQAQIELKLYGQSLHLFVQSSLGLGQKEMARQFLNTTSCFANNFPLPDGETGQGDASLCEQEVAALINTMYDIKTTVQPVLAMNPITSWYTIGAIPYLADNPLFHFKNNEFTNQNLMQQGDSEVCHQQWDTINKQFPNNEEVYDYCLFPAYYYALMVDGYGIYPEQTIHYIPSTLNVDWTKGVVLHH